PTKHIISYDKELNPLETISLTFPASDFIVTEKGFLLHNLVKQETLGNVVRTDRKGTVMESYMPFPDTNGDMGGYFWGIGKRFIKTNDDYTYIANSS
ncbi:MAG: hypothetical protein LBG28_05465, partial [Tannerella sp.]|nr:hypothetical protein [Tannerella sp.]